MARQQARRWACVVAWSGIALGACHNDAISLSEFGPQLLDAGCAAGVRCGQYPDKERCLASTTLAELDQVRASVAAGKIRYDATAAAACLESIRSGQGGFASCSRSVALNGPPLSACQATFTGTLDTGAACLLDEECVSAQCEKTTCGGDVRCCLGACAPAVPPIAIDGDCSQIGTPCVVGAYCKDTPGAPGVCATKIAAGQPCDNLNGPEQCAFGTICIFSEPPGPTGSCLKLPAEGAPCSSGTGCDAARDQCALVGGSPTCTPRIAVGGGCSVGNLCVPYATCDPATQICAARGSAGEACGTPTGPTPCLNSLQCIGDLCTLPPPEPVCPSL